MKYKLLSVNTPGIRVNIGDYIQALASSQFLPHLDGFVNREALDSYNDEETKIVFNGWFMHNPEHWPPSKCIIPLFIAFHLNPFTGKKMLTQESIEYLKNNEPIGCRDTYTRDLLLGYNIKAYFSGCVTLTLGKKFHAEEKENKCYFVDPIVPIKWSKLELFKNLILYLLLKKKIDKLSPNISFGKIKEGIKKKARLVSFYLEYSKYFTDDTIFNAEYIEHESADFSKKIISNEMLLEEAERLIKKYSRAKLVVTSRIHCALPCLGLKTPVIYVDGIKDPKSATRLEGLKELFNVLKWDNNHLIADFDFEKKFSLSNLPQNKDSWEHLCNNIEQRITDFIFNK